jgi:hypothetical protein
MLVVFQFQPTAATPFLFNRDHQLHVGGISVSTYRETPLTVRILIGGARTST